MVMKVNSSCIVADGFISKPWSLADSLALNQLPCVKQSFMEMCIVLVCALAQYEDLLTV
jgi:hypothetical protein